MRLGILFILVLMLAGASQAVTIVSSCGTVASQDGENYTVDTGIACAPDTGGIDMACNNCMLNFSGTGQFIAGPTLLEIYGVEILPGFTNVTIKGDDTDGAIQLIGFGVGVGSNNSYNVSIWNMTIDAPTYSTIRINNTQGYELKNLSLLGTPQLHIEILESENGIIDNFTATETSGNIASVSGSVFTRFSNFTYHSKTATILFVAVGSNYTTFDAFSIDNSSAGTDVQVDGALYINTLSSLWTNVTNSRLMNAKAIYFASSDYGFINGVVASSPFGPTIQLDLSNYTAILNSTASNTNITQSVGNALYISSSRNILIANSTFNATNSPAIWFVGDNTSIVNSSINSINDTALYVGYRTAPRIENLYLFNNTIKSNTSYGIDLKYAINTTIANSTIISNISAALVLNKSNYTTIANNTLNTNGSRPALHLYDTHNTTITKINAASGGHAALIDTSHNVSILNSIFISSAANAIHMNYSNTSTITNVLASGEFVFLGRGISMELGVGTNITNVTATGAFGIYFATFKSVNITNLTANSGALGAVAFYGNGLTIATITNSTLLATTGESVSLSRSSNITFINSSTKELTLASVSHNITYLNTTLNRFSINFGVCIGCNLTIKWYVNFTVDGITGIPVAGASVNATSALNGQAIFNGTTDSKGDILELAEFIELTATGTFTYDPWSLPQPSVTFYNNYTFYANKTNYYINFTNSTINESTTKEMILTYGEITTCETLIQNTTLIQDIEATGTCFEIGADDVTLDCDGYNINGSGTGYGVRSYGRTGTRVVNCNFFSFNTGILYTQTNNSLMLNNSANSTAKGYWINDTFASIIANSTSVSPEGVRLQDCNSITAANLTLIAQNDTVDLVGIYIDTLTNSTINNVTIDVNNTTSSGAYGIYMGTADYNEFKNIWMYLGNSTFIGGIYDEADFSNYTDIRIIMVLDVDGGGSEGITIAGEGNILNNINVTYLNNSPEIFVSDLFSYYGGAFNNTVSNMTLFSTGLTNGIYISGASNNNTFYNSTLIMLNNHYAEINLTGNSIYNSFINTTFNHSDVYITTGSNISVGWWPGICVLHYNGTAVGAGVPINVSNSTGGLQYDLLTDADGCVRRINFTEYFANGTFIHNQTSQINYTVFNPLNATAKLLNYYPTSNLTNVTNSDDIIILLNPICGSTLTANTTLEENLTCNEDYYFSLELGADDITLDCAGFEIDANGAKIGLLGVGRDGLAIKNCILRNANYSNLYLNYSTNSLILNNTLYNGSSGSILLGNSNSTKIYNTTSFADRAQPYPSYLGARAISGSIALYSIDSYYIEIVNSSFMAVDFGDTGVGWQTSTDSNNTVLNSTFISRNGIYLANLDYTNITNSTIISNRSERALYFESGSSYNRVINSSVFSLSGVGVQFASQSNYNYFENNTISGDHAITSPVNAQVDSGNYFVNNYISGTVVGGYDGAIYLYTMTNTTFINSTLAGNFTVLYGYTARDTYIINSSIIDTDGTTPQQDIYARQNSNILVINSTFDRGTVNITSELYAWDTSNVTVKWVIEALVTYAGTGVPGVTVNATPVGGGAANATVTTLSDGTTEVMLITELVANGSFAYDGADTINVTFNSNWTFYAEIGVYNATNSSNVTEGDIITFAFDELTCPVGLSKNTSLLGDLLCSPGQNAVEVLADQVYLNCSTFKMKGGGDSTGVLNNGYDNVIIANCEILNFTHGIWFFDGAEYGLLTNNSIYNVSDAGISISSGSNYTLIEYTQANVTTSTLYYVFLGATYVNFSTGVRILNFTGYTTGNAYGINLVNATNTTIGNSSLEANYTRALQMTGSSNSSILNNTLRARQGGSLYSSDSESLLIEDNFILQTELGYCIDLYFSDYSRIINNTGIMNGTGAGSSVVLGLYDTDYVTVDNNSFIAPLGAYPAWFRYADHNTFNNVHFRANTTDAVYIRQSENITITNSTIISNLTNGVVIRIDSQDVVIKTSQITTDAGQAVRIRGGTPHLRGHKIINSTLSSNSGYALYLAYTDNFTIINSTILASTDNDIFISSSENVTFLNTTFNRSDFYWSVGVTTVSVQWFASAHAENYSGTALPASINYTDSDNVLANATQLDAGGNMPWIIVVEFTANGDFIYNGTDQPSVDFKTPYNVTVNITVPEYFTNSSLVVFNRSINKSMIMKKRNPDFVVGWGPVDTDAFDINCTQPDDEDLIVEPLNQTSTVGIFVVNSTENSSTLDYYLWLNQTPGGYLLYLNHTGDATLKPMNTTGQDDVFMTAVPFDTDRFIWAHVNCTDYGGVFAFRLRIRGDSSYG